MTMKMWNPYPGVPNPSLAQAAEYVRAGKTQKERDKRKQEVFVFTYSAGPQKVKGLINYLERKKA